VCSIFIIQIFIAYVRVDRYYKYIRSNKNIVIIIIKKEEEEEEERNYIFH